MYREKEYRLVVKDARNAPTPDEIEMLIYNTFNNLRVEVKALDATPNDELREWISIKRTTHEQSGNDSALRVLDELEELIDDE